MKKLRLFTEPTTDLFIRMMSNGEVVICDRVGEPVPGGCLITVNGDLAHHVDPELAKNAGVQLVHESRWNKEQAVPALHRMLSLKLS